MKGDAKLSPRLRLLDELSDRVAIINACVEHLRRRYPQDDKVLNDLEEACDRALELFEKLRGW